MRNILSAALIIIMGIINTTHASDCFNNTNNSVETNATVFLEISDGSDQTIIGSGFVGPNHKIYTAKHLIPTSYESITIINNFHQVIGNAKIDPDYTPNQNGSVFFNNDVTRLKITQFNKESPSFSESAFNSIVPLQIESSTTYSTASITSPFGVSGGASGAPVINNEGKVIGIVSAATVPSIHETKDINLNTYNAIVEIGDSDNNNYIKVPDISHVYIAPIQNENHAQNETNHNTHIHIPAYPQARCIIFQGEQTPTISNYVLLSKAP